VSGHSKWAQIRRQKGVNDARRGQIFTRLGREIIVAVREGGSGDPAANFRLRMAIQHAKEENMPTENIERSIKRALGGGEGANIEEITYEGYGPGGTAVMVQVLTDNRNRTVAEIRNVFSRNGGNLGENGCVDWIFVQKGVIEVPLARLDADEVTLLAIDAGAEDVDPVSPGDETLVIYTEPTQLDAVRAALQEKKIPIARAELDLIPNTTMPLDEKQGTQAYRLIEKLEELDDVQNVYTNADFPESVTAQMGG
jgi:YebC/PmpR family DNA-binding regulatory protein